MRSSGVLQLTSVFLCFLEASSTGNAPNVDPILNNPKSIQENTPVDTSIGYVSATDSEGDTLTYGVFSQTPSIPAFTIDANSGVIKSPSGLDAETTTSFSIVFSVSDGTSSSNSVTYVVNIQNVNDNYPQFTSASYTATIYDTVTDGTVVLRVTAVDADSSDTVSYAITAGDPSSTFALNSSTGQLTVKTSTNLNPSTTPTYTITVQASDGTHSNITSVVITVQDNPCSPDPCQNSGTCIVVGSNYTCNCASGWIGNNCEIDDLCASSPCLNGGTCQLASSMTWYNCSCVPGWLGNTCDIVDHCASTRCEHDGTCLNHNTSFICLCPIGWIGENCSNGDPCVPNPCENSGTCTLSGTTYTCTCPSGYSGTNCTSKVSEPKTPSSGNKAAIIGGVIGGIAVVLVVVIVIAIVIWKNILNKMKVSINGATETYKMVQQEKYSRTTGSVVSLSKLSVNNSIKPSYENTIVKTDTEVT